MTFPVTRQSVVRDLASADPARARGRLRRAGAQLLAPGLSLHPAADWRRAAEDAQDLTQEFFARAFEREYLERYDPAKARFRTFVRTCLDGFLANERQAASPG